MIAALKLIHILSMVGTFGGLLVFQFGLTAATRASEDNARAAAKLFNILIGIGLLAGIAQYVLKMGWRMGPHYNGVIGLKFMILLAVGGLLAMSRKPGKGNAFRLISCALLAVAAASAVTLYR
jgi:hypothetical protein